MMNNNVSHPKHYTQHPSGVECIEIVEHYPFNLGAVIKYIWRAGLKDDDIQDLKKAQWYLDREINKREKEKEKNFEIHKKDSVIELRGTQGYRNNS